MAYFVLIGGGECGRPGTKYETEKIDKEIINLTQKKAPHFLLIALGNNDPNMYFALLGGIYQKFGCTIDEIREEDLENFQILKRKIDLADIIYVGGGNSSLLMKKFRKYGIVCLLEKVAKTEKVLCGLSAGAICWCRYGDSKLDLQNGKARMIRIEGLGFIDVLMCPHYDAEELRRTSLKRIMKRTYKIPAIALDNCSALEIVDNHFRIISSMSNSKARKCYWKNNQYICEELEQDIFNDISLLLTK